MNNLRSHSLQVDRVRSRVNGQPLRDKTERLMGNGNNWEGCLGPGIHRACAGPHSQAEGEYRLLQACLMNGAPTHLGENCRKRQSCL